MRIAYNKEERVLRLTFDVRTDDADFISDRLEWLRPGSAATSVEYMRNSPAVLHSMEFWNMDLNKFLLFKLTFGGAA
ncbi:hypothetical protein SAMN05192583_0058 [Sphingomonas gellani]|uniref:Uncharacterized protein n=1 Tax=Sphingomonas gellani TaxID=1166340 RepID=A0A1H7Y1Y7_9SPHN|nr:hypothetical protein [Sphingomonas gellani]SEM40172.1 hypothetical protein SAMN05192583_0058 [Sphingomonas gellani]